MASIILIGNKATRGELQNQINLAKDTDSLVLIDSSINLTSGQLKNICERADNLANGELAIITCDGDIGADEILSIDASGLMDLVVKRAALPVATVACSKSSFQEILSDEMETLSEIGLKLIAKAILAGNSMTQVEHIETRSEAASVSNGSYARSLSALVETFTIEELFPQHAWKEHSEESAAASYHALTAYFMRFEDYGSADQCLKISDQLEESPRSLALRALIAFNRGETLGAVANLVSSLQQYEERKKSTTHYIKFCPRDIEVINESLVSGLDALNKRDNEKAIDHFAKAVFNFDGFYAQHGLEKFIQ